MPVTFKVAPVKAELDRTISISINDASKIIQDFWKSSMNIELNEYCEWRSCQSEKDGRWETKQKIFDNIFELSDNRPINKTLNYQAGTVNYPKLVQCPTENAIIGTVFQAYATHMPLILSPDDFWLMISLAVSQFLGQKENAEKYRKTFVEHDKKMELSVKINVLPENLDNQHYSAFVSNITQLVMENTKTSIAELLTNPFSTTGPVEATVFKICLMESMKNYFMYGMNCICGIPTITLEGKVTDYSSIIERIDAFMVLIPDFEWYLQRAKGHMKKVQESFEGKADITWWNRMIMVPEPKQFEGYGATYRNEQYNVHLKKSTGPQYEPEVDKSDIKKLKGWISDFFPYAYLEDKLENKPIPIKNTTSEKNFQHFRYPMVTMTPFEISNQMRQEKWEMKLVGGFVGTAKEVTKTGDTALRPAIGWFVYKIDQNQHKDMKNNSQLCNRPSQLRPWRVDDDMLTDPQPAQEHKGEPSSLGPNARPGLKNRGTCRII